MDRMAARDRQGEARWLRGAALAPAESIRRYVGISPAEDFSRALIEKFCAGVWLEDEDDFFALRRRPVLYLANHQVTVESAGFVLAVSHLIGEVAINAIAKAEHRQTWLGQMLDKLYTYPGNRDSECMQYVPLSDGRALLALLARVTATIEAKQCGLLVHVAGSRMLDCRTPVRIMSSAFLDLAIARSYPVLPLKFRGGLPVDRLEGFIDFPVGYGSQEYLIGRSIMPAELEAVPPADRRSFVLDRINSLGGSLAEERPGAPDAAFKADVHAFIERYHILDPAYAVIVAALRRLADPSEEIALLLRGLEAGQLRCAPTPSGKWLAGVARWLTEGRLPVTFDRA